MTAALFFIPVLSEFLKTGLVPKLPTLVVCGFLTVASLLALVCGGILDTMINKEKQDFEFRLQIVEHLFKEKVSKR